MQGILAKDLIFIDESGVNLALTKTIRNSQFAIRNSNGYKPPLNRQVNGLQSVASPKLPLTVIANCELAIANCSLTRLFARSPKGQRAYSTSPQKRGRNVSMIGALSLSGVVTQLNLIGATDGLTFEAFISEKLVPKLWAGACVVMDNCSIHLGEEIQALIEQAGAKLIYLPPYSPDFSPIENCWSKIKSILRSIGARTYPDLAKAIEKAFNQVSLKDIQSWFTHCCYCTSLD